MVGRAHASGVTANDAGDDPSVLPRIVVGDATTGRDRSGEEPSMIQRVDDYYTQTAGDYRLWSPRLNMHFGFWKPGMSLFDRERMLEQMNIEVFRRLLTNGRPTRRVLDFGCGVGTAARSLARYAPATTAIGITAVQSQAADAGSVAARDGQDRPPIVVGDFCGSPFASASFDAVYSIESSCYAPGKSKARLLAEMARVTAPGGRMVVADAFLKAIEPECPVSRAAHRGLCEMWALETLGHLDSFVAAAGAAGFEDIVVEDISENVLPSALHAPFVMTRWAAGMVAAGSTRIEPWRWRNALVGIPLAVFAADTTAGGYYIVSATRQRSSAHGGPGRRGES